MRLLFLLLAAAAFFSSEAVASPVSGARSSFTRTSNHDYAPGIKINLSSPRSEIPSQGYLPVTIKIENKTDKARTWKGNITVSNSRTRSYGPNPNNGFTSATQLSLTCPPDSTIEKKVLVLIPPVPSEQQVIQAVLTLRSKGLDDFVHTDDRYRSGTSSMGWPETALTTEISKDGKRARLIEEAEKQRKSLEFIPSELKWKEFDEDWRGLTSYDLLLGSESDWDALSSEGRSAMTDWLHLGGHLYLYSATTTQDRLTELGLPGAPTSESKGEAHRRVGLGKISLFKDGAKTASPKLTAEHAMKLPSTLRNLSGGYRSGWKQREMLGDRELTPKLIIGFMVAFFIFVGPVNFFLLAKQHSRHRLFLTIPIISLLASLGILASIFVFSGFGGNGARFTLIELTPPGVGGDAAAASKAYVTEESAVQTELLLSSDFAIEGRPILQPVILRDTRYTHYTTKRMRETQFEATPDGKYGEGWLESRGDFGFVARSVLSTRERIEFTPSASGKPPSLVSGLGIPLERFFFIAPDKSVWSSTEPAIPGSAISLTTSTQKELETYWELMKELTDSPTALKMGDPPATPGQFIASASSPGSLGLGLGDAIEWKHETAVLFGSVMGNTTLEGGTP